MIEDRLFKKIAITLFVVVTIFLFVNFMSIFSEMKKNDQLIDYYVGRFKRESDSIIELKQNRIDKLMRDVYVLDLQIRASKTKIDSLEKERKRIQYVFINKLKEIDKYDAKQLEEYWRNEFE